jgi:hypothetical protein
MPDNVDRKKKWLKMATLVFEDRKNNGKDAHERRAKDLPDIPNDDSDNGGEDATLGAAFCAQLLFLEHFNVALRHINVGLCLTKFKNVL